MDLGRAAHFRFSVCSLRPWTSKAHDHGRVVHGQRNYRPAMDSNVIGRSARSGSLGSIHGQGSTVAVIKTSVRSGATPRSRLGNLGARCQRSAVHHLSQPRLQIHI
ncbi:Protein SCAR (Protein WAVE) [Psidium guajava]|nr:Protein SCAR (Protein WAVE) [Psidium guajava]